MNCKIKMWFVKTENFCPLKDNIKVNERQGIYWEKKICAAYISNNGLVSRICK